MSWWQRVVNRIKTDARFMSKTGTTQIITALPMVALLGVGFLGYMELVVIQEQLGTNLISEYLDKKEDNTEGIVEKETEFALVGTKEGNVIVELKTNMSELISHCAQSKIRFPLASSFPLYLYHDKKHTFTIQEEIPDQSVIGVVLQNDFSKKKTSPNDVFNVTRCVKVRKESS